MTDESVAPVSIDIYFDAACAACAKYTDLTKESIKELVSSGVVELIYHPIAYLNDKTPDDYSNRAGAYILAVAEYVPKKAFDFINAILSLDFISDSPGTTLTPDSKFTKVMEDLKFTEEEIDKVEANKEGFVANIIASTNEFISEDSDLKALSSYSIDGLNSVYTPFVLVNKNGSFDQKSIEITSESDILNDLLDSVNNAKQDN